MRFFRRAKDSDDGKRVLAKHQELLQLLNEFAKTIFEEWSKNVGQASNFNLKQHLITRNPQTHLIKTNFDPQVIALVRLSESNLFLAVNRCSPGSEIHATNERSGKYHEDSR